MDGPDKRGQPGFVAKSKLNLNPRECEMVAAAWLSAHNPQIDWDKFADLAGFKNAHSARTCFGPLKKKLHEQYNNGKVDGVVKSYEWKPRQRKKNARSEDEGNEPEASPAAKKAKKGKETAESSAGTTAEVSELAIAEPVDEGVV